MKTNKSGWHRESRRHSLAARGIGTPGRQWKRTITTDLGQPIIPKNDKEYELEIRELAGARIEGHYGTLDTLYNLSTKDLLTIWVNLPEVKKSHEFERVVSYYQDISRR